MKDNTIMSPHLVYYSLIESSYRRVQITINV